MKKIFFFSLVAFSSLISAAETTEAPNSQVERVQELDKSIEMLKKWQKQFTNKQRSYESRRRRILFKTKTPKDAQRADRLAQEAQKNALEIQTQIDLLEEQKQSLLEAPL